MMCAMESRLAARIGQVTLAFRDPFARHRPEDATAKDISAAARLGDSLFLACDEAAGLECLAREGTARYGGHRHVALGGIFDLPGGSGEEMDIEGLAVQDGWLWVLGSHAVKRGKPGGGPAEALARIAVLVREPNRYVLGRLPLEEGPQGVFTPRARVGGRRAAALPAGPKQGLARWLRKDRLIAPFLGLPAKENGLDIEGIAVAGDRVWLGLRGPVIAGHAVLLELEMRERRPGRLAARRLTPDGPRYRRHLLDTGGLGIRDLRRDGADLLLLVGPTMALQGAAQVLRWRQALRDEAEGFVPAERLELVAELPYGRESDHPEALELWPEAGPGALLVICDAPGEARLSADGRELRADVYGPAPDAAEPAGPS